MEALLPGTSAARNSKEVDEFFGIFSRIPVSLMDSARREEIFGAVSWFDVFFPFTTCTPSGNCYHAPRLRAVGRCAARRLYLSTVVGLAVK